MFDSIDNDLFPVIINGIEDTIISLSDSIGFGLGVKLFTLMRVRVRGEV
jgi:hypothetical protein